MTTAMMKKMRTAARLSGMSLRDLALVFDANLIPLRETDSARADRIQEHHLDKMIAQYAAHPSMASRHA